MVNAINALPNQICKRVYLKSNGPLEAYILKNTTNVKVIVIPKLPIIYRKIFSPHGIIKFFWLWLSFIIFIKKEHKKHHFHSAYVNTLSTSFILPILKFIKISTYIHVHEIIDNPKIIGRAVAFLSLKYAKKIVCVSKAVEDGMLRYYPLIKEKSIVIHNGIKKINAAPLKNRNIIKFYLFGRIMPKKGHWYLLEALDYLDEQKLKNIKIVFMGGTLNGKENLLENLKKKITQLNLDNVIEIKGFSTNIANAMSDADVCLVPSIMKDPFPTTVIEAMSAGRPVISTNHGGAKEAIIDGENGFLIPPNNARNLADTILSFINEKEKIKSLGQKSKNRYLNYFTLNHFNEKWLDLNLKYKFI